MGYLHSSSVKSGKDFKKAAIIGLCLLLLGVLPLVQGSENLQPVVDVKPTTSGAMVGWNITHVGDVNRDGDEDYAVGAPGEDMVYIFHGPLPKSFTMTNAQWKISGPSGSQFGWDIQSAGDYNEDGYGDIIIGSPEEDKAYVFRGRSSSFPSSYSSADFTIAGTTGERFGHSVCGINLDGNEGNFAVVGAPKNIHYIESIDDNLDSGAVFLFNLTYYHKEGDSELVSTDDSNFIYKGDEENGQFGFIVRNMGSVNNDELPDLGIGDPYYSPGNYTDKGAFYLHYGKDLFAEPPEKLSSNLDGIISGKASNSKFGWSAQGLGDIKATSEGDFFVGAPFGGVDQEGEAYLIFGTATAFSMDLSTANTGFDVFNGSAPGDRFGISFDLTLLDGPSPYIISIGAPGYDNGTMKDAGAIYSFWSWSSVETTDNANSVSVGDMAGENHGYSLCEVNYTIDPSGPTYLTGILAGSPHYGSNDNGRIQVLRRNKLPELSAVTWDYNKGSLSKQFTLRMEYKDPENDPPAEIKVNLYNDSKGENLVTTVPLQAADTNPISEGVRYEAMTTLPNSITPDSPDRPFYLRGTARAQRGSIGQRFSAGGIVRGMYVDGVPPSAPDNLNEQKYTSLPENELIPGTFKITFEWPEDNNGFANTKSQKVEKMEVRYLPGNQTIDASNWNSATLYKSYQSSIEIKNPFASDSILLGEDVQIFKPMLYYSVAMRAWDEVDNIGPVSSTIMAQAYWERPQIPDPVLSISVSDYMGEDGQGDDGGKLLVKFVPPQINPGDIGEYRVFVTENNTGLEEVSDIAWEPDRVITRDDEEGFFNYTFILDSYHNGDLNDGESYYVSVVPVNWLDQHARELTWSDGPTKVINNNLPPIPRIRDVDAISIDNEGKIRVTWTPTTFDRFTRYEIHGQSYPFNDIEDAVLLGEVKDMGMSEFMVTQISGSDISQAHLYSFAVLVEDHNDHKDTRLDDNNTVHGVKYVAPDPSIIPPQIKGVSMTDVPNDGGSALTLSWFKSFSPLFWSYNIYFDDEPIETISGLEPITVISSNGKTDTIITEFKGKPLIDGKIYHSAVTIVDWNLLENTLIDENNTASAKSINQSDHIAPTIFPSNLKLEGEPKNTEFTISWDSVDINEVIDFNHYLITYTSTEGVERIMVEDIETDSLLIDRLKRGTEYNINISVVDDAGNIGPSSPSIQIVTSGTNQPPEIIQIVITIDEDLYYIKNDTDTVEIDLSKISIIYFQGEAQDDYTRIADLTFMWNITLPSGTSTDKTGYSFDLDLSETGTYTLKLIVMDSEKLESDPLTIEFKAIRTSEDVETNWTLIILAIIGALVMSVAVIVFVVMSGNRSQKKQRLEEYEEKRQDIMKMEPIYTNLPIWTCDCGTTQVPIIEHAYCNACYQSHEAVPIDGIDEYLKEHELVLGEMNIDVPPGWQGQDEAISRAKTDLEERKSRALDSLNEKYAPVLKGTKYESELKEPEPDQEKEEGGPGNVNPPGPLVPGQGQPQSGPVVPGQPGPIRPTIGGQPAGGPVKPPVVPQAGAPGQRPPMPQAGQQQKPPQPTQQQ